MADDRAQPGSGHWGRLLRTPRPPASAPAAAEPEVAASATVALIEHTIIVMLLGGLVLGVFLVLRPLATALLFGAILAIATWPLRRMLVRAGLGHATVALLMLLAALLLIGLPLLAAAPRLTARLAEAGRQLELALAGLSTTPPDWIAALPVVGSPLARSWQDVAGSGGNLSAVLEPYAEWIRESVLAAARALADSVLQFVLSLIVAAMFWANGDALGAVLHDVVSRLGGRPATEALEAAAGSLRSVAYGVVGTAFIQGALMGVGAIIAGLPAPGLLGFLVMLLAISQIGAPLIIVVWGGGAWWLFLQGQPAWGIFLLVWGAVMVSASDNLIRPLLIRRGNSMPLTLVILGVFGGFLSFGFLGLFIGPALLAVAFTLLRAWRAVDLRRQDQDIAAG